MVLLPDTAFAGHDFYIITILFFILLLVQLQNKRVNLKNRPFFFPATRVCVSCPGGGGVAKGAIAISLYTAMPRLPPVGLGSGGGVPEPAGGDGVLRHPVRGPPAPLLRRRRHPHHPVPRAPSR